MLDETQTEKIRQHYATSAGLDARIRIHRDCSRSQKHWYEWLFEHMLAFPRHARILEVGCGTGSLWQRMAAEVPPGWRMTLTDSSPAMVERARANLVAMAGQCEFACVDVQRLPFPDASFDAVLANHMLYHVPDRASALSEMWRVLKPGRGILIAATNGQEHLREFRDPELLAILGSAESEAPPSLSYHAGPEFTLETGGEEVQRVFGNVSVESHDDELVIRDVSYLVDYHASLYPLDEERRKALERYYEAKRGTNGAIHVSKSSGVFIASRA